LIQTTESTLFDAQPSQADRILKILQSGRTLTPLDALRDVGCFRLGARVFELKRQGYNIVNLNQTGKNRFARYKLEGKCV